MPPSNKLPIHLSTVLTRLNEGKPAHLKVVSAKGKINDFPDAVSLSFDRYKGTRSVKLLRSNQIRTIHDVCIISYNDTPVFL